MSDLDLPDDVYLPKEIYQLGNLSSVYFYDSPNSNVVVGAEVELSVNSHIKLEVLNELKTLLDASTVKIRPSEEDAQKIYVTFEISKEVLDR